MSQPAPPLATIAAALRRERERVGISLAELARRAGLAKSTLSQLESGTGNPSVETLWSLGVALGVPFSRLVEPPEPLIRVVRSGEGPRLQSDHADFFATLLAAGSTHARRDDQVLDAAGQMRVGLPGAARLQLHHVQVAPGMGAAGGEQGGEEVGMI